LVRDGMDALVSALSRWRAPLDFRYAAAKARFVPVSDVPYYALREARNRLYRLAFRGKRLRSWGPRISDMDAYLVDHPLDEVCALQWQRCVDLADQAFMSIAREKKFYLRYEEFVSNPNEEISRLADWLRISVGRGGSNLSLAQISTQSIGKGRNKLDLDTVTRLERLIAPTLARHGYQIKGQSGVHANPRNGEGRGKVEKGYCHSAS